MMRQLTSFRTRIPQGDRFHTNPLKHPGATAAIPFLCCLKFLNGPLLHFHVLVSNEWLSEWVSVCVCVALLVPKNNDEMSPSLVGSFNPWNIWRSVELCWDHHPNLSAIVFCRHLKMKPATKSSLATHEKPYEISHQITSLLKSPDFGSTKYNEIQSNANFHRIGVPLNHHPCIGTFPEINHPASSSYWGTPMTSWKPPRSSGRPGVERGKALGDLRGGNLHGRGAGGPHPSRSDDHWGIEIIWHLHISISTYVIYIYI